MRIFVAALLVLMAAGSASAQSQAAGGLEEVLGMRSARWVDGKVVPGGAPDAGNSIWDNTGITGWWSGCATWYINIDWGKIPAPASGLDDHVLDGFTFSYGTNNRDFFGESFITYFFDSCTGWGNMGCHEASFIFKWLPNGLGLPTVPPGFGWIWTINVDLQGTGYDFLLGQELGFGMRRENFPTTGYTGIALGHRHPLNGTENAYDVFYPTFVYNGTWWFGSTVWATWPTELFGRDGQSNMTFYGVGARGNDTGLHAVGTFAAGSNVEFLERDNGFGRNAYLAASYSMMNMYIGGTHDVTRLVGSCMSGFPMTMNRSPYGDYHRLNGVVSPYVAGATIYFQALLSGGQLMVPPIDASNGIRAN